MSILGRIADWNERTAQRWGERWPWYARARQRAKDGLAERDARLDAYAQAMGRASWREHRAIARAKKQGYRWCVTCEKIVRPQPPWGFVRIVSLSLLTPGRFECPVCRGTAFREPSRPTG